MSSSPQTYADAAGDAYTNRGQDQVNHSRVDLGGQEYRVFGYKDDPATGFHGTAYQNVKTHEVIIAYRGTDPGLFSGNDKLGHAITTVQDIAVDATMVRDHVNPQVASADAFTQEMIKKAQDNGVRQDQITVAGHSLGGTLAEAEAAKFQLSGATFNAFGAVGIVPGVPEGGSKVTDYVIAGDVVSAANHHYGQVMNLATAEDIQSLKAGRYVDAPAGSPPPNSLMAMRLGDHGIVGNFDGANSLLNPANFDRAKQRYADNKGAVDAYRGDVYRERGELATALRQMESGKQPVNLPPEIQRQVNEYLAVNVDPAVQKAIEQNANVAGVEHGLQRGADGVRAGSHYVQTQDERVATAARTAGNVVAPVAPLAPLAGAAFGEAVHLHGQAVHAVGDYAANTLESARQTVELEARNVSRTAQEIIHNPEVQAAAVGVVNRIVDTYGRAEAAGHAVEQSYESAKRSVSQGIDAAEHSASQAYNTVTHPLQSFESAVASRISADMSPAVDPARLQQRALHGENSQVDRTHEAQRQQETQGHTAAHEAPLPPAPAAISPGARTPEREAPPSRQEPRPAVREQEAQAPMPAHHEPTIAPAAPDHAALAAQQAHQQAMHAQRQAQQERRHDDRAAPASHSHVSPEPHAVAAAAVAAPVAAAARRETSPAVHEPPAPAAPAEPARRDSAQASAPHTRAPEHRPPAAGQAAPAARDLTHAPSTAAHVPATHAAPQAVAHAPTLSPPLDPPALKDFRDPAHPLNERYQMFRDALGEQGFHEARPTLNDAPAVRGYSAEQKDRLAAGFTAQMGSDRQFNTEIQNFRKDGDALLAIEHPERLGDTPLVLEIPEKAALARSPEQHAAAWRARELPAPEAVNTQRPDPRSLSPEHPGHPDHPRNAMFEHTREALTTEYARWGMQKGAEQLDRETVQVMTAARKGQMDDVGAVRLMPNRDEGKIGAFPKMQVFETAQAAAQGAPSTVIVQGQTLQQAPPVLQAAPQFHVEDQQATQQMQQNQQLQAQVNAQAPQGPGLGR